MIDATPLLRAVASRRVAALARQDPVEAQGRTLRELLRRAEGTRFGHDHRFWAIGTVREFQARVPLRRYEDMWRDYWQGPFPVLRDVSWPGLIPYFALSSGTSGGPTKHIPVSRAGMRSNTGAAFDTLAFHLHARPHSRVFGGANFLLGGSVALQRLAPGVQAGDLSGLAAGRVPIWARSRAFPPRRLALLDDWEAKVRALAPASLARDIRSISGTPSWMLLFFEHLATLRPGAPATLRSFYPNLELLVHGGVAVSLYEPAFQRWLAGSGAEMREVYPASEGFVALADRGPSEGLRLVLDRGLFFEFVRPDDLQSPSPERRWIATAETGVDYALVLSSNAGLWSYVIGDTVRLIELNPPRVLVSGRTAYTLNAFGEHLVGEELDAAVAEAARSAGTAAPEYAAGAVMDGSRGHHLFVVETEMPVPPEPFARALDEALGRRNADYLAHRRGDFGMDPPAVRIVPPGTFTAWMARRGKLGGQNKVPRVISDPDLLVDLQRFTASSPDTAPRSPG